MNKSAHNPIRPEQVSSEEFFRQADAAMRRAQRVAERENARYGMKLVLASSLSPAKRKARRRAQGA